MCYQRCIEELYIRKYKCLPNPFIYENFILINSNQTEHRICDQNKTDFTINEKICDKQCIKDCNEVYISTRFDNSLVLMIKDSKITIKSRNNLEFKYESAEKYSFTDFMSNIGGLFGLWFGITIIDMSEMIQSFLLKAKHLIHIFIDNNFIINFLSRFQIFRHVKLISHWIRKILDKLALANWRNFIKFVSLPLIIYQIYDLTDDYLNYPMDVSVEWFPYKDTENRLSDESIPAITVCYEHIFERILFEPIIIESFNFTINAALKFTNFHEFKEKPIIKTNNLYYKTLLTYYWYGIRGFIRRDQDKNFREIILYYLDVNNRTEFIERQFRLNDKNTQ